MKRILTTCMLIALLAFVPVRGAQEYFTAWTEYDPGGYLAVTESSVVATNVPRNQACYVSKDFTSGYFEDFEVRFQFTGGTCSHSDYTSFLGVFAIANVETDWHNLSEVPAFGVKWSQGPGGYYLSMAHEPTSVSTWTSEIEGDFSTGVNYFITITRDFDGGANGTGQYVMQVCTTNYYGESGAVSVATQTLDSPAGEQSAFQYAIVTQSRINGGTQTASGTVSNLEFVTAGSTDPPAQVTTPNPANAATNVSVVASLSWASASGAISYDLYFGESTTAIDDLYIGNFSGLSYVPILDYETEYHWRVDSENAYGTTTGTVWTFTTATEASQPANIEDFTDGDWLLVDALSQLAIADTNQVTATALSANHTAYIAKDFGLGFFGGDLLCSWRSSVTTSTNLSFLGMLGLADATTDYQNLIWGTEDAQLVYWRNTSGELRCYLAVLDDGTPITDYAALSAGTEYFFTLSRDDDGGTYSTGLLTLTIDTGNYRNLVGATEVDTLTVSVPADEQNSFRYAMTAYSMTNQGASLTVTGEVSDLDLGVPTGAPGGDTGGEPGAPGAHGPYYVSPNGSNSYPGTSEADAWQSISFALANATLDANDADNVIYLLPGDHGSLNLSSKTWASSSWSNEWRIQGQASARLSYLEVSVHDAYLDFNDINVTKTGPHDQNGNLVYFRNTSDLKLRGGTLTGYWDSLDSVYTTGKSILIRAETGQYCEEIEIDGVTTIYSWDSITLEGQMRNGVVVKNCTIIYDNQSSVYCLWAAGLRDGYNQVEFLYNTNINTAPFVSSSRSGAPHRTSCQLRGNNIKIVGHRATGFGGSGGIRFYESYGPFNDMTVEDSIFYSHGEIGTIFGAFQCGTNVRIVNNTFVSTLTPTTSGNYGLDAYQYNGSVQIGMVSGADIEFADNIVVGSVQTNSSVVAATTGGNNLVWSFFYDGAWRSAWDANDIIMCTAVDNQITEGYTRQSFQTPGEIFIGTPDNFAGYFDSTSGIHTDWSVWNISPTSVTVDAGRPSFATATDVLGNSRSTPDIGAFEYQTAGPPDKARGPVPLNGATDVSVATVLQWQGAATDWNLHLGSSPSSLSFVGNQQAPNYQYDLDYATTYYWRVDANNAYGTTTGDIWSFTTDDGLVDAVTGPQPVNGAGNQDTSLTLRWTGSSGVIGYNVYLGTDSLELLTSTSATQAASGTLSQDTTYYWRVDAVGPAGTTTGALWSFTTYDSSEPGEDPGTPGLPDIPTSGVRVRPPSRQRNRSDRMSSRYAEQYEALTTVEITNEDGLPGDYVVGAEGYDGDGLSGWLERIVIVPTGSDTQWSLTIADSWGGELFSADDLDMTEGVVSFSVQNLPFVDGLRVTFSDTTGDTADAIQVRLYITETWRR